MLAESIRPYLTWDNPVALPFFEVDSSHPRAVRTLCATGLFRSLTRDSDFVPFVTRVVYATGRHWSPAYVARCTKGGNFLLHKAVGAIKNVFRGRKIVSVKADKILLFVEPAVAAHEVAAHEVEGPEVEEPEEENVTLVVMEVLNDMVEQILKCVPSLPLAKRGRPRWAVKPKMPPAAPKPHKKVKYPAVRPYLERYTPYQQYMIYEMVRNLYVMGHSTGGEPEPLGVRFMCWFYRSFIAPSRIPHPPDMDIPGEITHKNTLDFMVYIKRSYPNEWGGLVDRAALSYIPDVD